MLKRRRTLHSSRRLCFNELTNAKMLVLHSSHFALNWRCCTAVHQASALAVKFKNLGPPLSNVTQIIHMPCILQEIQTYKIESIFFNHAVFLFHVRCTKSFESIFRQADLQLDVWAGEQVGRWIQPYCTYLLLI